MLDHHPYIRLAVILFSCVLIYVGLLYRYKYEPEKKIIKSFWEEQWIKFDDYQSKSFTKAAAFLTLVLDTTLKVLDAIFGISLFSIRFLSASIAMTFGGTCLVALIMYDLLSHGPIIINIRVSLCLFLLTTAFTVFALLPHLTRRRISAGSGVVLQTTLVVVTAAIALILLNKGTKTFGYIQPIEMASTSLICDVAFLSIIRRTIRWSMATHNGLTMFVAIFSYMIVATSVTIIPIAIGNRLHDGPLQNIAYGASFANVMDTLLLVILVSVTLSMLLNRILLPPINRMIYDWANTDVDKLGSSLVAIGTLTITACFVNAKSLMDLASTFAKK